MAASTRNFYTYNISTEEAALVAEDTRCCDRSHGHAAARARAICARPKILIVYKDGRYAIVHAGQQVPLFGHGWLIQEPCDTSLVFARGCVEADEVTAMLTGAKEGLQEEHKNRKVGIDERRLLIRRRHTDAKEVVYSRRPKAYWSRSRRRHHADLGYRSTGDDEEVSQDWTCRHVRCSNKQHYYFC